MDEPTLLTLLDEVRSGEMTTEDAVRRLRRLPFADLGFAKVDHHRELRQSFPEAVYAPGKSPQQCSAIVGELLLNGTGPVLLSRADAVQIAESLAANLGGVSDGPTVVWRPAPERHERVTVITAGTADLPVATECIATLRAQGFRTDLIADVGVAGLHRFLASMDHLEDADVLIVAAGMEGALASLVAGVTAKPLIALPTSVGYGSSLEGVTALLAMTASCAPGITVVGIDNGFGAACAAGRILHRAHERSTSERAKR